MYDASVAIGYALLLLSVGFLLGWIGRSRLL